MHIYSYTYISDTYIINTTPSGPVKTNPKPIFTSCMSRGGPSCSRGLWMGGWWLGTLTSIRFFLCWLRGLLRVRRMGWWLLLGGLCRVRELLCGPAPTWCCLHMLLTKNWILLYPSNKHIYWWWTKTSTKMQKLWPVNASDAHVQKQVPEAGDQPWIGIYQL